MIVWPGLRRSVSAISRLFNSAAFDAPLTHSAIPTRAASGTTATFTRATTKTIENNDGYLVTLLAGEIGFPGARRVRNLLATASEDFSVTTGITLNATPTTDSVVFTNASAYRYKRTLAITGPTLRCSLKVKSSDGSKAIVGVRAYGVSSGREANTSVALTTEYQRISILITLATVGEAVDFGLENRVGVSLGGDGTTTGTIQITEIQVEDVTAQTTQTAGEYVSVGVPGDWAGDELVTNGTFTSNTSGWTTDGSTFVASGGAATLTNTAAANGYAVQVLTTVAGSKYVASFDFTLGTSAAPRLFAGTTLHGGELGTKQVTASGFYTLEFTATGTTTYLEVTTNSASAGVTATFDNISVKPALYHGSFADGVKCFATDINGAAIPSSTLLGYSAEGARTNLCLQSNAFTTTWVSYLTPSATQNVIGPDGATSAWTLTDNDPADVEEVYQDISLTAAAYTFSIFVKKTTGAQSSYPALRWFIPGLTQCAACTIDTSNGVATAWTAMTGFTMASGVSASCVSFNSNFWRVSLTKTGTAATHRIELLPAATANATQSTGSFSAAVQGSAVFYGAQVELGSFASSYIATTTVAVTRNADVLTYSSAGNILGTAGWVHLEYLPPSTTITQAALLDPCGATGRSPLYRSNSRTLSMYDGTTVLNGTTMIPVVQYKLAASWGSNQACSVNGAAVISDAFDGDYTIAANIAIGSYSDGSSGAFGTIRNVRIGQRQLSASELQAITA